MQPAHNTSSHCGELSECSCLVITSSLAVAGAVILALAAVCASYGYISTPGIVKDLFVGGSLLLFTSFIGFLSFARSKARETKPVVPPTQPSQDSLTQTSRKSNSSRNFSSNKVRPSLDLSLQESSEKPLTLTTSDTGSVQNSHSFLGQRDQIVSSDSKDESNKVGDVGDSVDSSVDKNFISDFEKVVKFSQKMLSDDIDCNLKLTQTDYQKLEFAIAFLSKEDNLFPDDQDKNQDAKSRGNGFPQLCLQYLKLVKSRHGREQRLIGQNQDTISILYDGDCLFISFLGLVLQKTDCKKVQEFEKKKQLLSCENTCDEVVIDVLALRQLIVEQMRQDYKKDGVFLNYLICSLLNNYIAKKSAIASDKEMLLLSQSQNQSQELKRRDHERRRMCTEHKTEHETKQLEQVEKNIDYLQSIFFKCQYNALLSAEDQIDKLVKAILEIKQLHLKKEQRDWYKAVLELRNFKTSYLLDLHFFNEKDLVSCFDKVSKLVEILPITSPAHQMMNAVARKTKQYFKNSFAVDTVENSEYFEKLLVAYFEEMETSGICGGNAEIYAAHRLFGVPIIIYDKEGNISRGFGRGVNSGGKIQEGNKKLEIIQLKNCFVPYIPEFQRW